MYYGTETVSDIVIIGAKNVNVNFFYYYYFFFMKGPESTHAFTSIYSILWVLKQANN